MAEKPVHVRRHTRRSHRRVYDPQRAEYYDDETGEVLESEEGRIAEVRTMPAPKTYRELPRGQHAVRKDILRQASLDLTALGYQVGGSEDPKTAQIPTAYVYHPEDYTTIPVAHSGLARDRDLLDEVELLRRQIGSTDRINRRGVAGALVIVAVARRRNRIVQPREIVDAENPDRQWIDPEDTQSSFFGEEGQSDAEIAARLDAEENAIRQALRIVRERLREREAARPRPPASVSG